MPVLAQSDRDALKAFFSRALELQAEGATNMQSVLDYLMLVVETVDRQDRGELETMRSALEDAWRPADA